MIYDSKKGVFMIKKNILKVIWYGSWLGTFSWVFILSLIFILRLQYLYAFQGFSILILVFGYIRFKNPWMCPNLRIKRLMIIPYFLLVLSIIWILNAFNAFKNFPFYYYFFFINIFIPFFTIGNKRGKELFKI